MAKRDRLSRPGTPEFLLAAYCSRWPPSDERNALVRAGAAGVDWELFLKVVKRHRVEGLVWAALRRAESERPAPLVPPAIAEPLGAAARAIAARNLRGAAESLRLRRAFDAANIPILFLKGLTLGALVYGDPSIKTAWDIDVLIDRSCLVGAAILLEGAGYSLVVPDPRRRARLEAWHDHSKESVWHHPERDSWVELHTRLVDNERLLNGIGMPDVPREVEVARGISLPTLPHDELFAYLCVHGASSAWFRLKWIADLGALLSGCEPSEIERLYERSQALGAGRAAAQALLLSHSWCGTGLDEAFHRRLSGSLANRWLWRMASRQMAGPSVATELKDRRFGTAIIHLSQLGLLPGFGFKLSELTRQLAEPLRRLL